MSKEPLPFKVLKDNILVMKVEPETVSEGGVVLPRSNKAPKDPFTRGVILAVGNGLHEETDGGNSIIPDYIKPGMIVIFHTMAGWDMPFDGKKYTVVSWRQVEAMVDPDYVEWSRQQSAKA